MRRSGHGNPWKLTGSIVAGTLCRTSGKCRVPVVRAAIAVGLVRVLWYAVLARPSAALVSVLGYLVRRSVILSGR
jgi:hypothetical protein